MKDQAPLDHDRIAKLLGGKAVHIGQSSFGGFGAMATLQKVRQARAENTPAAKPEKKRTRWTWTGQYSRLLFPPGWTKEIATVFRHKRSWQFRTYDGKNTALAGERGLPREKAQAAALKWAKEHLKQLSA